MPHKRSHLDFFDIVVLTLIFFGTAIYTSTAGFLHLQSGGLAAPPQLAFHPSDNWRTLGAELVSLAVAAAYLQWRRFEFRQLDFGLNRSTPLKITAYILAAGLAAALFECGLYLLVPEWYPAAEGTAAPPQAVSAHWSVSLFALALANGFYEEVFFMGLAFAVRKEQLPWVLLFSLLVRFAFHTYQGLAGALTITTLGVVFILLRLKFKDLVPFMLAHSFFDVFGLSWPLLLLAEG